MSHLRVAVHRRIPLMKIAASIVSNIGAGGVIGRSCQCCRFGISGGARRPYHMTTGASVGYGSADQKKLVKMIIEKNKDVGKI